MTEYVYCCSPVMFTHKLTDTTGEGSVPLQLGLAVADSFGELKRSRRCEIRHAGRVSKNVEGKRAPEFSDWTPCLNLMVCDSVPFDSCRLHKNWKYASIGSTEPNKGINKVPFNIRSFTFDPPVRLNCAHLKLETEEGCVWRTNFLFPHHHHPLHPLM